MHKVKAHSIETLAEVVWDTFDHISFVVYMLMHP